MNAPEPIDTRPLFQGLHDELVTLLRGLEPADWDRATVAGRWRVRDVAAHLLDTQARRLSMQRDGHLVAPDRALSDFDAVVGFLDDLNASWVTAMRRLSPHLLVDLLEAVGGQYARFMAALDLHEPAAFPVAWAGEDESENWFDIGRDYTELWHHQAQIRLAVGAPGLDDPRWLGPVLDLAVRALPRALATEVRPPGTAVVLHIDGPAGGTWTARSQGDGWAVGVGAAAGPESRVELPADVAWKLFFNAVPDEVARRVSTTDGDAALVDAVLRTRSVMVLPASAGDGPLSRRAPRSPEGGTA